MHFLQNVFVFILLVALTLQVLIQFYSSKLLKKMVKENKITGFLGHYKADKWLKSNVEKLSEEKQILYKKYIVSYNIQYILLFIAFVSFVVLNITNAQQ